MTFSIVAYDPNTGDFGVAVQSKFICVGPVVPFAEAKIGTVATQAHCNTSYGPRGLEMLRSGMKADQVLKKLLVNDKLKDHRQVGLVDSYGNASSFTGKECFHWAGHVVGNHFACQGNILINADTVEGMAKAFETTKGDLPTRLLAALHSADQKGRGDARGQQSASLLVVRENGGYGGFTDRWVDIRVDEHAQPIKELHRIFQIYDMTMLEREDPTRLLPLEEDRIGNIIAVLEELGYLVPNHGGPIDKWTPVYDQAFENWVGINNFENKWRKDGKIWQSIYDYMMKEKGTPFVSLKKMSEI